MRERLKYCEVKKVANGDSCRSNGRSAASGISETARTAASAAFWHSLLNAVFSALSDLLSDGAFCFDFGQHDRHLCGVCPCLS